MLFVPTRTDSLKALRSRYLLPGDDQRSYVFRIAEAASKAMPARAHALDRFFHALMHFLAVPGVGRVHLNVAAHIEKVNHELKCDWRGLQDSAQIARRLSGALWPGEESLVYVDGIGDALALLGVRYGSVEGRRWANRCVKTVRMGGIEEAVREAALQKNIRGEYEKAVPESICVADLPRALALDVQCYGVVWTQLLRFDGDRDVAFAFFNGVSPGIGPIGDWESSFAYRVSKLHHAPVVFERPRRGEFSMMMRSLSEVAAQPWLL